MAITKLLMHKGNNPVKTRILVNAPTGVAAVNLSWKPIHSSLGIMG